jgi:hypothetical protein
VLREGHKHFNATPERESLGGFTTMPLRDKPKVEPGWTEQNAPDLIQWNDPGMIVLGILTSVSKVIVKDKPVIEYLVTQDGGKQVKFLQTHDLAQKLRPEHRGDLVRVEYLGQDENIRGGPSNTAMKVFNVQTKRIQRPQSGPVITDEDIPF